MFGNLSGPTLLVILFIVLLLFGAPKLPGLAKSLGQSMRILKKEVRSDADESTGDTPSAPQSGGSGGSANGSADAPAPAPKKPNEGDSNPS